MDRDYQMRKQKYEKGAYEEYVQQQKLREQWQ